MRLQPGLVPACFLAAFCYFFFPFFFFFPGACELQGHAKVKLYHFGDEMQADVAVSRDTVPAPPCWGPWVVPGTPDHVRSLAAPSSDSDFKAGARLPAVHPGKVTREIALNFHACVEPGARSCCLLGLRTERRQVTDGLRWCFPS